MARATHRPPEDEPLVDSGAIDADFRKALARGEVAAGWPAVIASLSTRIAATRARRCFVLFGSYHDAAAQLDAFTRLVGPRGIVPAPAIALEQLAAPSRFSGLAGSLAAGHHEAVAAYLRGEDSAELARAVEGGYSAWKHGYTERVWLLLDMARAHRREVVPCDVSRELQGHFVERLGQSPLNAAGETPVEVLRDVHCALTLADRDDPVVALFYGDAHLAPRRLPRFLPDDAAVIRVHMFGGRPPLQAGVEAELGLRLTDPLLFEVAGALVLLLDGHDLAMPADRVRVAEAAGLRGIGEGTLTIGADRYQLTPKETVTLEAREGAFLFEHGKLRVAGAVTRDTAVLDFSEPGVVRIEQR